MTRIAVRRAWFQVHKWIGLILMIALMPLAASGSLLLAHDWLGEAPPQTPIAAPLPIARYLDGAASELPGGVRISGVTLPTREQPGVVIVRATRIPRDGAPPRGPQMPIRVKVDASTAQPLVAQERGGGGFWMTVHRLHGSLLIPGWGRAVVGWLGLAMLVSCVSGLWIWWPTVSGFVRGLRWRRGKDWDFNLHHMAGFWIALPLAVLSLTGAWISFPAVFSAIVGEKVPQRGGGPRGNVPIEHPVQSIEQVVAIASARGPVADIGFAAGEPARWTATLGGNKRIAIDDATGTIAVPDRPRQGPVMRWMRLIHEGAEDTGPVWRAIVFVGGLIPVVLGITGLTMWLRSRRWRGGLARRQAARREQVVA